MGTEMPASILIVDDDEVVAGVLKRVLTRLGHTVWQSNSAAQTLQLARLHNPQLALLDLCLPDGDGLEVGRGLRALDPEMNLILITAYPMRIREHPDLARDFAAVLIKPLDLPELRAIVESCLAPCG